MGRGWRIPEAAWLVGPCGLGAVAAVLLASTAPFVPAFGQDTPPPPEPSPECLAALPEIDGEAPLGSALPARSTNLMEPHFGGGFGFYPVDRPPTPPRTGPDSPLEIRLAGPGTRATAEPLSLRLTFVNRTSRPLVVMRPLDGSLDHWRHPIYDLLLRDESNGSVYLWGFVGGRCGNVNAIGDHDYVTLRAGERRRDLANGWGSHVANAVVPVPGRYTAWVVYAFCGFTVRGLALGPDLRRPTVHVGVHASNGVSIHVR